MYLRWPIKVFRPCPSYLQVRIIHCISSFSVIFSLNNGRRKCRISSCCPTHTFLNTHIHKPLHHTHTPHTLTVYNTHALNAHTPHIDNPQHTHHTPKLTFCNTHTSHTGWVPVQARGTDHGPGSVLRAIHQTESKYPPYVHSSMYIPFVPMMSRYFKFL